jgi:hypothetical protein
VLAPITIRHPALARRTLANGGVKPVTGEGFLDAEYVRSVLSQMPHFARRGKWCATLPFIDGAMYSKFGIAGVVEW